MQTKRVLLLHISNISGHRSASLAIEKAIKIISPETQTLTLNAFNYTYPKGEKIINAFYMFMIKRLPFVWAHLYDNPFWVKKSQGLKNTIHNLNLPKLESLFNMFKPDVICTTQAFPCGIVADFKRIKNSHIPLVAVLTDFVPHSYWIYDTVNYYITPSEEVNQRLIKKGIAPSQIKTLGIPFDIKFNRHLDSHEIRKRLNLKNDMLTILIMGGGQGLGPIKEIVEILNNIKLNIQIIVVCGTNKKTYHCLKKRIRNYKKRILLLGYAQNIEELMTASDLIITKPGGITCAEALSKGLPMIIVSPIPGQEANNTSYLVAHGAAIKIDKPYELVGMLNKLYNQPQKIRELSEAALRISKPNAARDIAQLLLDL